MSPVRPRNQPGDGQPAHNGLLPPMPARHAAEELATIATAQAGNALWPAAREPRFENGLATLFKAVKGLTSAREPRIYVRGYDMSYLPYVELHQVK